MSDTPQNEEVVADEFIEQNDDIEINDSELESETSEHVQAESNEQVEVEVDEAELAKQKANEAFSKQYGQLKQAERERDALKAKQEEFERQERARQEALIGNIPPMPDAFDDDYDEKVKLRDAALDARARFNERNQFAQQQQQQQKQIAEQAKQEQLTKSMASYSSKAIELGIKPEELQAAGSKVATYGLSDDLVIHILNDSEGALITKHLAANPHDGYELVNMSPYSAGIFLGEIKAKASSLKPKTSGAPAPAKRLSGQGANPELGKYKYLDGATFE